MACYGYWSSHLCPPKSDGWGQKRPAFVIFWCLVFLAHMRRVGCQVDLLVIQYLDTWVNVLNLWLSICVLNKFRSMECLGSYQSVHIYTITCHFQDTLPGFKKTMSQTQRMALVEAFLLSNLDVQDQWLPKENYFDMLGFPYQFVTGC